VVFDKGVIRFVGRGYAGAAARRVDYGNALIGPGFVDLDALADLDTTILGYDNQPAWKKAGSVRAATSLPVRSRWSPARSSHSRSAMPSPT